MKLIVTPRRHGVPITPGTPVPSPEEYLSRVARGRQEMTKKLMRLFPQAKVIGISGQSDIIIDIPDSEPDLPSRIRASLDVETGRAEPEPGLPVARDIRPTPQAVAEAYAAREYRPTVVALVRDERQRILLVQSVHNLAEWMFVQGGIEDGEDPLLALARELREEIDFGPGYAGPSGYVGTFDLDAEEGRTDKRGFTKGKRYFIYEVAYRGSETLFLQDTELNDYAWVGPELGDPEFLRRMAGVRKGKAHLMIGAIVRTLR